MSTTEASPATRAPAATYPTPARPGDDRFLSLAAEVGAVAAAHADAHDRDATFVSEAYDAMRANGYLRLAVPEDLGGLGASIRQVCYAQAELARQDGSTALAVAMHLYLTLMQGFRRRQGAADAEAVLRRVAEDGLVIATSGGSDDRYRVRHVLQRLHARDAGAGQGSRQRTHDGQDALGLGARRWRRSPADGEAARE